MYVNKSKELLCSSAYVLVTEEVKDEIDILSKNGSISKNVIDAGDYLLVM